MCVAPFFVWYEVLFMLGYRHELHEELREIIAEEIRKYKAGLIEENLLDKA